MKNDDRRLRVAIASILSGATMAGSFVARAEPAATQASSDTLEEIVVTSRKRTENLQDIPQSIEVFSKTALEHLAIAQFEDYAARAPSISWISTGPGTQEFIMRGVSDGSNPGAQNTSTTGLYIDELSTSYFGGIPDLHLYDINRIEVLNGPQGTLFGASAMSGAVRIVTNKPDPSAFSGGFDLEGGLIDGGETNRTVEGFLNIPLIEGTTALRVSGFYQKQGGFINNLLETRNWVNGVVSDNSAWAGRDYNRESTEGARVALLHKFNDDWKLTLQGEYQHQSGRGAWDQNPSVNGERNVARFGPEFNEHVNRLTSLTVEGDVGIGDLTYVGGYWNRATHTQYEYSEYVQYANIPAPAGYASYPAYIQGFACATSPTFPGSSDPPGFSGCNVPTQYYDYRDHVDRWSQEARLSSKPGGSLHWTVGAYWELTEDHYGSFIAMPGIDIQGAQAVYYEYTGYTALPSEWYFSRSRIDDHQVAEFGELTADINDQLSVVGGIRNFKSNDSYSSDFANYFYQPQTPTPLSPSISSKVSYKAGINYKPAADKLLYFSFAQGFRHGGVNTGFGGCPLVPQSYKPDTLDSYEVGWKTVWAPEKIKWNGALYYMPWKDYQSGLYDPEICLAGTFNANIGNARIYGAETDFEISPAAGLTLSVSAAYNDSELTSNSFTNPAFVVVPGQRLPFVPYLKGTATARYERHLGADYLGYAQFDFSHTGDMWSDLRTNNHTLQPAYNLSTLRFGYNNSADSWGVEGYVSNIANERAIVFVNTYNYDHRQTTNEPRVFGVRIKYRFGGKT